MGVFAPRCGVYGEGNQMDTISRFKVYVFFPRPLPFPRWGEAVAQSSAAYSYYPEKYFIKVGFLCVSRALPLVFKISGGQGGAAKTQMGCLFVGAGWASGTGHHFQGAASFFAQAVV